MRPIELAKRLEMLEETVDSLKQLPSRMMHLESQNLLLRTEIRGEFSAIRQEVARLGQTLRGEMAGLGQRLREDLASKDDLRALEQRLREDLASKDDLRALEARLRGETAGLRDELRDDTAAMHRELAGHILDTQRQMRVLFEEVVARIASLQDAWTRNPPGRPN